MPGAASHSDCFLITHTFFGPHKLPITAQSLTRFSTDPNMNSWLCIRFMFPKRDVWPSSIIAVPVKRDLNHFESNDL